MSDRYTAGILAAEALAWLAVPVPLVGVLTGFVVFTATPLWIGLTKRANPTSTRGLFVPITSIWCGTVLVFITTKPHVVHWTRPRAQGEALPQRKAWKR
ncbi:hypothetical protein [Nocardia carnea]|uniref:hypothetical protein n=1 Tax=Nocardia carnea TaxID=37328 RepID=UPI002457394A|nr:hypothetical protein [Nocardia carnea]